MHLFSGHSPLTDDVSYNKDQSVIGRIDTPSDSGVSIAEPQKRKKVIHEIVV